MRRSRGFANPALRRRAPYGLILANILAGPLVRMAPAVARHLGGDGRAILSGLLTGQAAEVAAAYGAQGLRVQDRFPLGGWTTLAVGRG